MFKGVLGHVRRQPVAFIALFFALGSGAYASVSLPRNSVGAAQIQNKAVTPPKLANSTVRLLKGRQGPRGATGPQGSVGPPGPPGQNGTNASINGVSAGGDLTGTYPAPTIADAKVTGAKLADGSVTTAKFAAGAQAPNASELGGIAPGGYVQGGGTVYSGHPDSTPARGAQTILTIPNQIQVFGQCTSSGGNSDVAVQNNSGGNVFMWKVVAGQAATSLTLTPFDPMNPGANTDFGPVTPVSQVTWQGTSAAGAFTVIASAYSNGSVCHFNGWAVENS